jgi:hypothetical protein
MIEIKQKEYRGEIAARESVTPAGHFYRVVWRWHFYAGLFVVPFMVMLAVTGIIYLFKPQLDRLMYHDLMVVAPQTFAGANVDSNQPKTAEGCMSGQSDADCAAMFANLGLPFAGKPAGGQNFFSVEKGRAAASLGKAPGARK